MSTRASVTVLARRKVVARHFNTSFCGARESTVAIRGTTEAPDMPRDGGAAAAAAAASLPCSEFDRAQAAFLPRTFWAMACSLFIPIHLCGRSFRTAYAKLFHPHKLLPAYLKWRLLQVCGNGGLGCEDALMSVPCANFKAPALLGGTAMASGENCPVKEF